MTVPFPTRPERGGSSGVARPGVGRPLTAGGRRPWSEDEQGDGSWALTGLPGAGAGRSGFRRPVVCAGRSATAAVSVPGCRWTWVGGGRAGGRAATGLPGPGVPCSGLRRHWRSSVHSGLGGGSSVAVEPLGPGLGAGCPRSPRSCRVLSGAHAGRPEPRRPTARARQPATATCGPRPRVRRPLVAGVGVGGPRPRLRGPGPGDTAPRCPTTAGPVPLVPLDQGRPHTVCPDPGSLGLPVPLT